MQDFEALMKTLSQPQAPNRIVREWIESGGWGEDVTNLRTEVTQGDSRYDFAYIRSDVMVEIANV